ncbi:type I restriction enzyme HsdR N-terminal domain-containing protein [Saliphagus sp. LR7]|uniref:type I restriction enzyme HsdR N-terminal domain-containing protein n=1 Tax=Saliphagus sp. LR7 TaxID=2282654 RepID=UPI000DF7EC6C|nr:type I restriction enzyme HsdR N-terminal domain-containing protein [Saliphagus sp. LR7]
MDEEAVQDYVEKTQSLIDASPQMDEANTKAAVLRDFLDLLDWEIPTNTKLEYSVEAFGQTYKVDYALIIEETPVAFLEAKGVDTSLTAKHDEQLSSYMTNRNVNYGILTNGERYRFFQRRVDASNVDVRKISDSELVELPDQGTVLRAYTRTAIESGESRKILERINELREARRHLEADKDRLATELAELLAGQVSETVHSLAESQSKELIDRLVEDIEREIDSDEVVTSDENEGVEPTPARTVRAESGKYVIEIRNGKTDLATVTGDNQSDVTAKAVDYLIENHDLTSEIKPLPYIPGREKAIINDTPTSPHDEEAMRAYRELTNGYHIDTHANKGGKMRIVEGLVDKCGLAVSFEGEWNE